MGDAYPVIWWLRRDLRLADNPALSAAAAHGGPVIPVFIGDDTVASLGAAAKWRLGLGLDAMARRLEDHGSRLVLRRGDASDVLRALIAETGAGAVVWNRLYDPSAQARDRAVKAALLDDGIEARSFGGHLLHEPWTVETGQGGFYKVYTPYWNAVKGRDVAAPEPAPGSLRPPETWPVGDGLDGWRMGAAMHRGAGIVARHVRVGEARARERLDGFIDDRIQSYRQRRDFPAAGVTSGLSENLTWGEIGPRTVWAAGMRARDEGAAGAEHFLKELVWREFAWHLLYHTPRIATGNWREEWDGFPWRDDNADAERWRRGMTGVEFVDAGMREMYVTGTMHNRVRMIVASFLTKHLTTHWKVGLDWFAECLIDWDPASNAMGWQWAAGSGPDASPYFRVFNPDTQAQKFDPDRGYRDRFIAERAQRPGREARDFFRAVPAAWGLDPDAAYPDPVIGLAEGRERALGAYGALGNARKSA